jgi:hypothetical protein
MPKSRTEGYDWMVGEGLLEEVVRVGLGEFICVSLFSWIFEAPK